jgi:FkbM family methyltransferase
MFTGLKDFLANSWYVSKIHGSLREKISLLNALTRLQVKQVLSSTEKNKVAERFLNYSISAFDYKSLAYLIREIFVFGEYYFKATHRDPLIIDCGSNIGISILYFKRLYPEARIIGFEANPHVFKLLEDNMKQNQVTNVELYNIALHDEEEEISFYFEEKMGTLMGSLAKTRGGKNELVVNAQKLSSYLKNVDHVDLIKMDVEGAEMTIVSDLVETGQITKAREYIIEYHHNMNQETSKLAAFLQVFEDHNFKYNIRSSFNDINSFQDILIHFYYTQDKDK